VTGCRCRVGRGKGLAPSYDSVFVAAGASGCAVVCRPLDDTDAIAHLIEAGGPDEDVEGLPNPPRWLENIGSRLDRASLHESSPLVGHRALPTSLGRVLKIHNRYNTPSQSPVQWPSPGIMVGLAGHPGPYRMGA
jgi:hypothetical protein